MEVDSKIELIYKVQPKDLAIELSEVIRHDR